MKSIFDESDYSSIMDWNKPLFFTDNISLYKVIASANKTLLKAQKIVARIESAEQTSRVNAELIPNHATIRKEYVRCGKVGCEQEPHGPYYYAYWKERVITDDNSGNKRMILKKKYIGTRLPKPIE